MPLIKFKAVSNSWGVPFARSKLRLVARVFCMSPKKSKLHLLTVAFCVLLTSKAMSNGYDVLHADREL